MADNTQLQAAIERIAKMDHAGVSISQIAQACNIDDVKLVELMETPKYKEALASIAAETFDKMDVLNGGWDMVENLAMNKVVDHLQRAPDPDYALKAAALANKAIRRGKHENNPIGLQPNNQAIINVSLQFADKLQQNFQINQTEVKELKKKDDNFLPPKSVSRLLGGGKTKQAKEMEELENELGDMRMFAPAF